MRVALRRATVEGVKVCTLEEALGRSVPCPEDRCAFWDGVESTCALEATRADLAANPALARFLLGARRRIERHTDEPPRIFEDLPPGLR